jgi:hypothetical protein
LPGNGSTPNAGLKPVGYFSYEPPIIPVIFEVGTDGSFSVRVATPLGNIGYSSSSEKADVSTTNSTSAPAESVGVTQLNICKAGSNRKVCRGYVIRTGRKLSISMNGRVEETIENGVVTIDAQPGATVTVTDDGKQPVGSGPKPAARIDIESLAFTPNGPYTEVNLEKKQGGVANDLAYDHVTGALYGINGAKVADIKNYITAQNFWHQDILPKMSLPGEADCAQTPPDAWQNSFTPAELNADVTVACIFTAEQDFG